MSVETMLRLLRDPLGAPLPSPLLEGLLVLTWVPHILFAALALAAIGHAAYAHFSQDPNHRRLGLITARLAPNAVGLAIVTGVAPLLFVQVVYSPLWYASASLEGFWATTFIFVAMGGYALAYLFYLRGVREGRFLWSALCSFLLLLFAGWIMHVLVQVGLYPGRWLDWYAPQGQVDTRGVRFLHAEPARFAFLLLAQAPLALGVALLLFAGYFRRRQDADLLFLEWVAKLGLRFFRTTLPLYAALAFLWVLGEGRAFGIATPMALSLGLLVILLAWGTRLPPLAAGPRVFWLYSLSLLGVALLREFIRIAALAPFGYAAWRYPWSMDWGGLLFFLATGVAAVPALAYLIGSLYTSGLSAEGQDPSLRLARLGNWALYLLAGWFLFLLGLAFFH